jgi:hypothetical protein
MGVEGRKKGSPGDFGLGEPGGRGMLQTKDCLTEESN